MRCWLIIGLSLASMQAHCQTDSSKISDFSVGVGVHLTQAMLAAPAVSGQAILRYKVVGVVAKYGRNQAQRKNIRGFDEVSLNGDWAEIGLFALVPTNIYWSKSTGGLKLGANFGVANTEFENREIFEAIPPFEDYVYTERYAISGQKYLTFLYGYQQKIHRHIEAGIGVVGVHLLQKPKGNLPLVSTPFTARSPIGLYVELNIVL